MSTESELKLYAMKQTRQLQSEVEEKKMESRKSTGSVEHAERGQFIPFAQALKKLG